MARRVLNCGVILLMCNCVFGWNIPWAGVPGKVAATVALGVLYLVVLVSPHGGKGLPPKLKTLGNGCELLLDTAICAALETALLLAVWLGRLYLFSNTVWIFGVLLAALLLGVALAAAAIRLFVASGQLTVRHRVLFLILWWVPVANIFLFVPVYRVAGAEYRFAAMRYRRNLARREQRVCATRYPILLVHGIFFRDWKRLSYWGRIPGELEANGAVIRYGQQQSSASVEASAEELKAHILRIVEETGCGKVNIIAHSKGGLDARYAISRLGMAPCVASLTTVNTPHRGCRFARRALDNIPKGVVSLVTKNYNKIFAALGDDKPDFFSGVSELTDDECQRLNGLMPDCEGILYQSVGARMKTSKSAAFPLNLGFSIVEAIDGANDGLVAIGSMPWGDFTMLEPAGRRGISHADVIDLTQKDVPGFDVCEFYVQLVQKLKERGL